MQVMSDMVRLVWSNTMMIHFLMEWKTRLGLPVTIHLLETKTIIPDSFKITAVAEDDGEIMGVSHKKYLIEGVQFHPESIMTDEGKKNSEKFHHEG